MCCFQRGYRVGEKNWSDVTDAAVYHVGCCITVYDVTAAWHCANAYRRLFLAVAGAADAAADAAAVLLLRAGYGGQCLVAGACCRPRIAPGRPDAWMGHAAASNGPTLRRGPVSRTAPIGRRGCCDCCSTRPSFLRRSDLLKAVARPSQSRGRGGEDGLTAWLISSYSRCVCVSFIYLSSPNTVNNGIVTSHTLSRVSSTCLKHQF